MLVNSADGLPDAVGLATGGHLHTSWAFSKAGVYLVKVRATGTLTDGTTVTSAPATYRIDVARAQHWVDHGAQATEAAARLLHRSGVKLRQAVPAEWTGPSATEGA